MKIVTYNVNSINARLPNLLRWLAEATPDVVCLQELKAPQEKFPETAIRAAGYGVIWHGQKSWNGVAILGPKFEYKLRWLNRLLAHAAELLLSGAPVVLAGDYNIIPTEADVYKPERWVDDALFRVEVRDAYAHLLKHGWVDSVRTMHPGEQIYTFWDFFRNAYGRDAGLRIDHLLLSPSIVNRLVGAGVYREVRGWEKASDHAPTWVEIKD
jgi:exodeoxyribonuclease III